MTVRSSAIRAAFLAAAVGFVSAFGAAAPFADGAAVFAAEKIPASVARRTGVTVFSNAKASIDASNLAEGYVLVRYTGDKPAGIKVQITKKGGTTYTYNPASGAQEAFPLSDGDGEYTINVFEHIGDAKYALAYGHTMTVTLRHAFLPFLYPNQLVNYDAASEVAKQAATLAASGQSDLQKLDAVYHYVVNNLTYDYVLAKNPPAGYIPNPDAALKAKKGICFDYASLMSAMLRSQNIPSKLVVGYTGSVYHAWVNVFVENAGWIDRAVYFDGEKFSLLDPTFASGAGSSAEIYKYIGTASNYSPKYIY